MDELQKQIDYLTQEDFKNKQEINKLKELIKELLTYKEAKLIENKNDKNISIIVTKYKKSIVIKNMYSTHNSTVKCKDILKELNGKWSKIDGEQGWIFVGSFSEGKSLETNSKFIIEKLESEDYELEVNYKE
jgi:hypothetical protein